MFYARICTNRVRQNGRGRSRCSCTVQGCCQTYVVRRDDLHQHQADAGVASYPTPNNTETVKSVIDTLEIQNLHNTLAKFTSFRTRCKFVLPYLVQIARLIQFQTTVVRYFCIFTAFGTPYADRSVDWEAEPAMASGQDHRCKAAGNQVTAEVLPLSAQLTKEYAPASLQERISIHEFGHSWQQSSIVCTIADVYARRSHGGVFYRS